MLASAKPHGRWCIALSLRLLPHELRMILRHCGTAALNRTPKETLLKFRIPLHPKDSKSVTWWPCFSLDQSSRAKLNWTCHLPCLLSDDYHHIASFKSIRFISLSRHWCVSRSRWAVYLWTPVQPTQSTYIHVCPLLSTIVHSCSLSVFLF